MVNSEPITQAEYQAELARAQAALGESGDVSQRVLDDLIDQVLLAQGAAKAGFTVDEAMIQEHMDNLAAQVGGVSALVEWLSAHGYRETDFRRALGRSIAAAWMRDQIIAAVPQTAEQIHARQILLYNEEEANQVLDQLRAGTNFATLAAEYDPVASGDLGWFPSGYLTEPALDQAAFALQAGQYSEVIKTRLGYHILQVIERDPQRLLEPDARQALQEQALGQWLVEQRSQSQIEIYLP
jgi:parvulin-like peptidyl-prolyl isomerase